MTTKEIPNPRTEYGVIKRYLHVLALLQNNKDPQDWNGSTLADILSLDESDGRPLSDKNIRDYIGKYLEEQLGIGIEKIQGGRRTELADALKDELLGQIASLYSSFVVNDSAKEVVLESYIKKHPLDGLWMLARIYFASLEKKRIKLDYETNTGYKITDALLEPYHLVFRNNNIYLVGKIPEKTEPWLFILGRVHNLRITDDHFEGPIPSVDDIFKNTLGSFVGKSIDARIRFSKKILNPLEQMLGILEPEITKAGDDVYEAKFSVSDDVYLCQQLFMHGSAVEILEPAELRAKMVVMLKESLGVYGNRE